MKECICCQCAEQPGDFKDYVQCQRCELFGHCKDDFTLDPEHVVCDDCTESREDR